MMGVDQSSKTAHFEPYHKIMDASPIIDLYFREIVGLHEIHRTSITDQDVTLLRNIWRTLWERMGTKLQFSSVAHPKTN